MEVPAAVEPPPSLDAGEGADAGDAVNPPGESVDATGVAADKVEEAADGADAAPAAEIAEDAAEDAEPDVEAANEVRTAIDVHAIAFVKRAPRSPPPAPSLTPICGGRRSQDFHQRPRSMSGARPRCFIDVADPVVRLLAASAELISRTHADSEHTPSEASHAHPISLPYAGSCHQWWPWRDRGRRTCASCRPERVADSPSQACTQAWQGRNCVTQGVPSPCRRHITSTALSSATFCGPGDGPHG